MLWRLSGDAQNVMLYALTFIFLEPRKHVIRRLICDCWRTNTIVIENADVDVIQYALSEAVRNPPPLVRQQIVLNHLIAGFEELTPGNIGDPKYLIDCRDDALKLDELRALLIVNDMPKRIFEQLPEIFAICAREHPYGFGYSLSGIREALSGTRVPIVFGQDEATVLMRLSVQLKALDNRLVFDFC